MERKSYNLYHLYLIIFMYLRLFSIKTKFVQQAHKRRFAFQSTNNAQTTESVHQPRLSKFYKRCVVISIIESFDDTSIESMREY